MHGGLDSNLDAGSATVAELEARLDLAIEFGRVDVARKLGEQIRAMRV
jgi:hypothetical protein